MTLKLTAFAAALAITGGMALDSGPASAQSWRGAAAFSQAGDSHVQNVQYRRWHRRHHGYYRRGWGPALGGFAAGAIIGGALAAQQAQGQQDWIAYCSAKYRSFDPASGTYLGYDGERHYCR
jgi:hypothetical protein